MRNRHEQPLPQSGRLLELLPDASEAEQFEALVELGAVRIERIVTCGQITPPGIWYDQQHNEWVLLLAGAALLQLEGEHEPRRLTCGDWLMLPAGCRHRVAWVPSEQTTVWLAVHWPFQEMESGKGKQDVADID